MNLHTQEKIIKNKLGLLNIAKENPILAKVQVESLKKAKEEKIAHVVS